MSEADTPKNLPHPEPTDEIDASAPESRLAEEADWVALTKKLRQHNRNLLKQVAELEQALKECLEGLQLRQGREQAQETLLAQQTEELKTSREQATRLFRELESSHQVAQRQQILIETLSQQLESSQERVAHMERECALTQQRYKEQSHKLLQAENVAQELQTRLQRQQRQTLQFKAALEKCLEMPVPKHQAKAEPSAVAASEPHLKSVTPTPPLAPKPQPIQPWSAQAEMLENNADIIPSLHPTPPHSPEVAEAPAVRDEELEEQVLAEQPELARMYELLNEGNADLPPQSTQEENDDRLDVLMSLVQEIAPLDDALATKPESVPEPLQRTEPIEPQPNWPSPVIYPLRPPKKLKSLAAIDLPNFPRHRPT